MSDSLEIDHEISRRLSRTWGAFFERFGTLTEVQRQVIPPALDGEDVLICSATASGKTEAAAAPLIERQLARMATWMTLYVVPTRALVNDLYERLLSPCEQLGVRLAKRTGESRIGMTKRPPHVILTTPESFDSMLCRARTGDSHLLYRVTSVVLDEIHLLQGTPRGEQVRWLLERLRRLLVQGFGRGESLVERPQVLALSATVSDPGSVAESFLHEGRIVLVPGGRTIEAIVEPADAGTTEEALLAHLGPSCPDEKVLVFCNARKRVDELAGELRDRLSGLGYETHAHHGSLAQRLREKAERRMRVPGRMVLFSTSTLEIGVDIGDVDLVVLDGPAHDVSGLLQRIGRGNRRTSTTRVLPCSDSKLEILVHQAMLAAAGQGWLGPENSGPQNAVARQQLASYLFQSGRRSRPRSSLQRLLDARAGPTARRYLLDHLLVEADLIEDEAGIRLNQSWLDKGAKGEIHGNIEGTAGLLVVDRDTGKPIAKDVRFGGGSAMGIGGKTYRVRGSDGSRLEVSTAGGRPPRGSTAYESRPWMQGPGQPQAVRRFLGIETDCWPVLEEDGRRYVFHFGGERRRAIIDLCLTEAGLKKKEHPSSEWYLVLAPDEQMPPDWLSAPKAAALALRVDERLEPLERILGRPQANRVLPRQLRVEEVLAWLHVDDEVAAIAASRWVLEQEGPRANWLREIVRD